MPVPRKFVSYHARTPDPLEDRDEHEDAEQRKKIRGGERMIWLQQDKDTPECSLDSRAIPRMSNRML
jgi:hypothetical protein